MHFLDKRSYVALDGIREKRFGQDVSVVRDAVMERDEFRCVLCGSTRDLEMDHIRSKGLLGGDEISNCRVLCGRCHRARHLAPKWSTVSS